jgi:hypothetical protein
MVASMKLSTLITIVSSLGVLAAGCGDDDDSVYSSGLDDDKPVSTLDDDDKRTFCRTLDTHVDVTIGFEEIARLSCLPLALAAPTREGCESVLDACMRNAPAPITIDVRQSREQACFQSLDSCEARVGDLEGCVNVNVSVVREVLERFSCNRYDDDSLDRDVTRAMQTSATCGRASASCGEATQILL